MNDKELEAAGVSKFELMVLRALDEQHSMLCSFMSNNSTDHKDILEKITKLRITSRELRLKSSVWGAVSAAIVTFLGFWFGK